MVIRKILRYLAFIVIAISIVLSAWYVGHGDLVFHSDIARDFALMQQMVSSGKPALVGEGVREIPGLYHGPMWLYMNMPAFILGNGNPIAVGWGWVIFEMLFLISIFFISKKVFDNDVAIIVTSIAATRVPLLGHQLINPSGAFLLFPTFFYFLWKYNNSNKKFDLSIATLLSGILIQCEIVFGMPMFVALVILVLSKIYKKTTKTIDLLYLLLILIPLSTYIAFDIRHNFAQIRSILSYLASSHTTSMNFGQIISNRIVETFYAPGILNGGLRLLSIGVSLLFFYFLYKGASNDERSGFYKLFIFINIVYWSFSLLIPGPIQGYYFDFSVICTMIFVSQVLKYKEYYIALILVPLWLINLNTAKNTAYSVEQAKGVYESSWVFNRALGQEILDDAPKEYSVFTLGTDIWGYSPRYGIYYANKIMGKSVSFSNKSEVTYLVIASDTVDHPLFDVRWWKEDQVRIKKSPVKTWHKGNLIIEKYVLTPDEVALPEDPFLMSTNTSLR